jgi:coenzyme F420-dependent glucose-6-phosphate dehydrogenase
MMVEIGYALSSEEHPALDLVQFAVRAERCGFTYASISDHFHPWIDRQGESTFVWSVLGAIANATSTLEVMTGVTCPIVRYHPTIVAQAAATSRA